MDKDRIKGKVEDISGRVKQRVGEWTGDTEIEAEGAKEQIKGKVREMAGKAKEKAHEAAHKLHEREIKRKKPKAA